MVVAHRDGPLVHLRRRSPIAYIPIRLWRPASAAEAREADRPGRRLRGMGFALLVVVALVALVSVVALVSFLLARNTGSKRRRDEQVEHDDEGW